ncbi:hypothetical protein JCM9957A_58960 [Kineosporia succinea]
MPNVLRPGEYLYASSLTSPSGRFTFHNALGAGTALHDNGTGETLWTVPYDNVHGLSTFSFGLDGDLVVWNHHRDPGWRAGTAGRGAVELRLSDAGDLELADATGAVVWSTGTAPGLDPFPPYEGVPGLGSVLSRGQSLRHQSLVSDDGDTVLAHTDFGVCLFLDEGGVRWRHPVEEPGTALELGTDGILRLRAGTGTRHEFGGPAEELRVLPGRVELRDAAGQVLWSAGGDHRPGGTPTGPRQSRLQRWFDSLAPDHGYTVAVVRDVTPEQALTRWGVATPVRATWQQHQAGRHDGVVPVAAVPIRNGTLLLAGAPDLPGDPLSPGTTVLRESRTIPCHGYSTEFSMHADGDTVAHLREAHRKIRKGLTHPGLVRAANETGVGHLRGNVDWAAAFAGLEFLFRAAGIDGIDGIARAARADGVDGADKVDEAAGVDGVDLADLAPADLRGDLLGGLVPAGLARPSGTPEPVTPPGRTPLPDRDCLLVRTDFSDDAAWEALLGALAAGSLFDDAEVDPVNDPAWAGATLDEVVDAVPDLARIPAVYIADTEAITGEGYPVLTVNAAIPRESEDYEPEPGSPRSIRVTADELWGVHVNLEIANIGWEEIVEVADPEDGVFRGY